MSKKWNSGSVGIQLDLGRQKETMEFMESFIKFISANCYDTLYLHLESGVRTGNFQFADHNKSYSPDELRHIDRFAAEHGVSVVPVIATLGHAEHFVSHPELRHISEQREKPENSAQKEFCPSIPETYDFLFKFLEEVSGIFSSGTIHAGCDEVFSLATCPLCRKRLEAGETKGDIFLKHILKMHEFITGKLGKKMLMWDDMADFFPELIGKIPRDIGMVFWEYDRLVEGKKTKFANRKNIDIFKTYESMGYHDYMPAPADSVESNISSIIRYASDYSPSGLFVTTWEHGCDFMYKNYTCIAFAGRLWRSGKINDADKVFEETVKGILTSADSLLAKTLKAFSNIESAGGGLPSSPHTPVYRKMPDECTEPILDTLKTVEEILAEYEKREESPEGKLILEDTLASVRERITAITAGIMAYRLFREQLSGKKLSSLDDVKKMTARDRDVRLAQWKKIRTGLADTHLISHLDAKDKALGILEEKVSAMRGLFEATLFLPDIWGAQKIEFQLKFEGEESFTTIMNGTLKPSSNLPYYTCVTPLEKAGPAELRISSTGHNGIGVAFCRIRGTDGTEFVPGSAKRISGIVTDPENMLKDDTAWSMFGDRDGMSSLFANKSNGKKHEAVIKMVKSN